MNSVQYLPYKSLEGYCNIIPDHKYVQIERFFVVESIKSMMSRSCFEFVQIMEELACVFWNPQNPQGGYYFSRNRTSLDFLRVNALIRGCIILDNLTPNELLKFHPSCETTSPQVGWQIMDDPLSLRRPIVVDENLANDRLHLITTIGCRIL